jgi:hypothetical protein
MTLDITTPLQFDVCDNSGNAYQIHDRVRRVAIVDVCADIEGTPRRDYGRASAIGVAYSKLFAAAPDLLTVAKRYRHLLSELHAGNAFSEAYRHYPRLR